jgi:hypothetical protein
MRHLSVAQVDGERERRTQTAGVGLARAGEGKRRAMVDTRAQDW